MAAIVECPVCSGSGEVPPWGPAANTAPSSVECWHCYGDGQVATKAEHNTKITIHPVVEQPERLTHALEEVRIAEHRRGEHPYGSMRRDCPMCVYG